MQQCTKCHADRLLEQHTDAAAEAGKVSCEFFVALVVRAPRWYRLMRYSPNWQPPWGVATSRHTTISLAMISLWMGKPTLHGFRLCHIGLQRTNRQTSAPSSLQLHLPWSSCSCPASNTLFTPPVVHRAKPLVPVSLFVGGRPLAAT
jgi:hypothetical protein